MYVKCKNLDIVYLFCLTPPNIHPSFPPFALTRVWIQNTAAMILFCLSENLIEAKDAHRIFTVCKLTVKVFDIVQDHN